MNIDDAQKDLIRYKLSQAKESVNEARGLLSDDADLKYVVNSLYYGFSYAVLALLKAKGIPAAMQSVSIAMFEKEFVGTGLFEQRSFDAIRKAFVLKPKCSGGTLTMITRKDVEDLLKEAELFMAAVSRVAGLS
jgi:uncharacterized protein (UPF0332 family)